MIGHSLLVQNFTPVDEILSKIHYNPPTRQWAMDVFSNVLENTQFVFI